MKYRKVALIMSALTLQSCAAVPFLKVVAIDIAGRMIVDRVEGNITFQQIEAYMDSVLNRFFDVTIKNNTQNLDIEPLRNNPLRGRMKVDPKFVLEGSHNPNTVLNNVYLEVDRRTLEYQRMTESSAWELTEHSATEVKKRLDIGAIQLALTSLGYECGQIDGKTGELTQGAIRAFQKNNNLKITGDANPNTRKLLMVEN